jgi:predicted metalloprotease with PDZ domain
VKTKRFILFVILFLTGLSYVRAQSSSYHYHLDLNNVSNDQLKVELSPPAIKQKTITFYMPNIIPGTYMESNYGEFVSDLKAFNKRGKELPVKRLGKNSWQIEKANKMVSLTYKVDDIYDMKEDTDIFGMSATNIDKDKNFVIHTPGFFGYFGNMKEQPFEVTISKPESFYGSTGLIPVSHTAKKDIYQTTDYDELMDAPMMYNKPDTSFIDVANARVLISVYSPNNQVKSKFLAEHYKSLLQADAKFLGGKLPVKKYAFILYFAPKGSKSLMTGALEHNNSSFYYLPEHSQERMASLLVDVAAHEFFHIVTPLTLHSEEIAYFNYQKPDLSEHLWLYEGMTEYNAHLVQEKYNIITPQEFLNRLAKKINYSKEYFDDHLPFTELSKNAAGKYAKQYNNVYQKGALINALLDIALLDGSNNKMRLQDLVAKLSKRYGEDHPFKDEELFDVITSMTNPNIGTFFNRYVAGTESLPYKKYFAKAGVVFDQEPDHQVATLGNFEVGFNAEKNSLMVSDTSELNDFGHTMGYQTGDLLLKLQGKELEPESARKMLDDFSQNTQEGDTVEVVISRPDEQGTYREMTLTAPAMMVTKKGKYTLRFSDHPTYKQLKLRYRWLGIEGKPAHPEDVESIDSIMKALYDVITGPAGDRDWDRFASFFKPEARLAAFGKTKEGKLVYKSFTPEEYRKRNEPFFQKNGFWEKELGRQVFRFGEIASIQSAYESRLQKDGKVVERGVNSIQLVYDQNRWWVTSILWNSERDDNPIPESLIKM